MKRLISVAFLAWFLISSPSYGQSIQFEDVNLADLLFSTDKEKDQITQELFSYHDAFLYALSLGESISPTEPKSILAGLDKFMNDELKPHINHRKEERTIKTINEKVNEKYLKVFKETALMSDVLVYGEYNCVTQATLFAYIFKTLEIPFELKIGSRCTFVMPYPDKLNVEMAPEGYSSVTANSTAEERDYIALLRNGKYITDDEYLKSNITELYQKYRTDKNNKVAAKELLALNYLLLASSQALSFDYSAAYNSSKIASFLFPGKNVQTLVLIYGSSFVNNQKYTDEKGILALNELARYNPNLISHEDLISESYRLYTNQVEINKDMETYDVLLNQFVKIPMADSTERMILAISYDYKASTEYQLGNLTKGYAIAKKSFEYSTKNLEFQMLFFNRFIATYEDSDYETTSTELSELFDHFPILKSNSYFGMVQQNLALMQAAIHLDNRKYNDALDAMQAFEVLYSRKKDELKPEEGNIISSYGKFAVLYFSKGQKQDALKMVNRALEIWPSSTTLQQTKRMILAN